MLKRHYTAVPAGACRLEGSKDCTLRWLVSKDDGAENFALRLFELLPGGVIPIHDHHDTEHEIFILEGRGMFNNSKEDIEIKAGDVLFIKPGEKHGIKNDSSGRLRFLCIIPLV